MHPNYQHHLKKKGTVVNTAVSAYIHPMRMNLHFMYFTTVKAPFTLGAHPVSPSCTPALLLVNYSESNVYK